MSNRDNGLGHSPFALDALSDDVVRRPPMTPFGDLESPFAWSPEREDEDEADEDENEDEDSETDSSRCPHCGQELEASETTTMWSRGLDEAPDDHEAPFLAEDSEEESYFETADAFEEEAYGDTEWEEQELEHVDELFEAEAEFASLSPSELKAVRITSTFETGHAGGFGGLTGNFDGQGLSFGLMNWTIKAGSLIPLLQEFIAKHGDRYTRIFGSDADRFKAMVFATRHDPDSGRKVRDVAAQMDFVRGKMNDASQKHIVAPWKTYFGGLENDPEFRAIEVAAARRGLAHAKRWFDRFGWKTERGFVFMFDLVSSHGAYWLDAKKFHGRREKLLAERTAQKKAALGRDPNELEMMEILANLIADVSLEKWRAKVRQRKLWFVHGKGKVHGTAYDLQKDFGVTDRPADFSSGSPPADGREPQDIVSSAFDAFGDVAHGVGQAVKSIDEMAAVRSAIAKGETDASKLTNLVFFARHPELGGRAIKKSEHALADEWTEILRTIVKPALAKIGSTSPPAKPSPSPVPSPSISSTTEVLGIDTSVGWDKHGHGDHFTHDWVTARAHGVVFSIPRAAFGTSTDPAFYQDWGDMKAAGIVRGGYLFLRFPHPKYKKPPPSPEEQAEHLIKVFDKAGLHENDFPPVLDVEFPEVRNKAGDTIMSGLKATGMSPGQLLDGVRAAWKILKDHYKVAPMIYTSKHVWRDDLDNPSAPDLAESPLWLTPYFSRLTANMPAVFDPAKVAKGVISKKSRNNVKDWHDPPIPKHWGDANNWWIHQYQGDGTGFPGLHGTVDMNRFHTMMPGETGDRVKWVQRRLGISQTGSFDSTMETALRSFKSNKGLTADAVIDPATFARLCWVRI